MRSTLVAALWLLACDPSGAAPSRVDTVEGTDTLGGDVVSTVDGVGIREGEVARVAELVDLPPSDALERLQEQELLAREAEARGFADDPAVAQGARRAAVQALLAQVEAEVTPASVPAGLVERRVAALRRGDGAATDAELEERARGEALAYLRGQRVQALLQRVEEREVVERDEQAIDRWVHAEALEGGAP